MLTSPPDIIDKHKSAEQNTTDQRFGVWELEGGRLLLCRNIMDDSLEASVADCLGVDRWNKCNGVQDKQW